MTYRPWRLAWRQALYGPDGFYRREVPADHFRTACHAAADLLAGVVADLADRYGCRRVVDVGAGGGELLTALAQAAPGLDLVAVELRERPRGLPSRVAWHRELPVLDRRVPTLLIGWELLDVVPVPVLEADDEGWLRVVEVDRHGRERLAGAPSAGDLAWCADWWPGPYEPGQRVEVGGPRERAWARLVDRLGTGVALAVDYRHTAADRPGTGSLTGFRGGRAVPPRPDGSCDLTAHVAWDSLAASTGGVAVTQAQALRGWLATRSPTGPDDDRGSDLARTVAAGRWSELLEPGGLGGFGWLLTRVGTTAAP